MATFQVDATTYPGVLALRLEGSFSEAEMTAFTSAHNAAITSLGGRDYRVFCDIRALHPLAPECAALFEKAKSFSASRSNFRGSAVWVATAVVAMQHRRTSDKSGVLNTELISENEDALWAHLKVVSRPPPSSGRTR